MASASRAATTQPAIVLYRYGGTDLKKGLKERPDFV
jgi:hypothetical protein